MMEEQDEMLRQKALADKHLSGTSESEGHKHFTGEKKTREKERETGDGMLPSLRYQHNQQGKKHRYLSADVGCAILMNPLNDFSVIVFVFCSRSCYSNCLCESSFSSVMFTSPIVCVEATGTAWILS